MFRKAFISDPAPDPFAQGSPPSRRIRPAKPDRGSRDRHCHRSSPAPEVGAAGAYKPFFL